jgi:hypothetical protein
MACERAYRCDGLIVNFEGGIMATGLVSTWSDSDKLEEMIRRSPKYMPAGVAQQFRDMLTPQNMAIMVGTLVVWAGSHFFGVGEIVDVGLLLVGAFTVGWSFGHEAEDLYNSVTSTLDAQSDEDLDKAAELFGKAVVAAGVTTILAILLHRTAKEIQVSRGPLVSDAARLRNKPGLVKARPDPQANAVWRKPTTTLDPNMPAGTGATTEFGDMTLSSAGSATDQQLVRLHELVHSYLSPRFIVLRTFRARLGMSAYLRSALLKYIEEAMAETYAQLKVDGLTGFKTGIRFPIKGNQYVSIQQLVCEGRAIGTVTVGSEEFSVQIVSGGDDSDDSSD